MRHLLVVLSLFALPGCVQSLHPFYREALVAAMEGLPRAAPSIVPDQISPMPPDGTADAGAEQPGSLDAGASQARACPGCARAWNAPLGRAVTITPA